jgi:dihydrofolate synthase/folylpolyglutamate synthase
VARWFVAPLPVPRGSDPARLVAALEALDADVESCADVTAALAHATGTADPGDRVLVFGSFHTVAAALGGDPG